MSTEQKSDIEDSRDNLAAEVEATKHQCVRCDGWNVTCSNESCGFTYGVRKKVFLMVVHPIYSCLDCGFEWYDCEGEQARDAAARKFEDELLDANRKIELDTWFCPFPYKKGGDPQCDHDFPPESKRESDHGADWTCSKCGMNVTYDFWD